MQRPKVHPSGNRQTYIHGSALDDGDAIEPGDMLDNGDRWVQTVAGTIAGGALRYVRPTPKSRSWIDLATALAALTWAAASTAWPSLTQICSPEAAVAFSVAAIARWKAQR